jgi:hypothetical protein
MRPLNALLLFIFCFSAAAQAEWPDAVVGKARKAYQLSGAQDRVQKEKTHRLDQSSAPTLALTAPTAYQKAYQTVHVTGLAGDNVGIVKIEIQAGNANWVTVYAGPPAVSENFDYAWDTSAQTDGNQTILVAAYDGAGNQAQASVTVQLDNANAAWWLAKRSQTPVVMVSGEFGEPYLQPIATMGWEDGVYISRDGLYLYCTYVPADFYAYTLNGDTADHLYLYERGPSYGQDFTTNPTGGTFPWLHTDILYSQRNSTNEPFLSWHLSGLARSVYSQGGFVAILADPNTYDWVVFTSNDSPGYVTNLRWFRNAPRNPSGVGTPFPSPYTMDNPHIERLDANNLVLFFDSNNWPNQLGPENIYYTTSSDNGTTWAAAQSVSTINTTKSELQPHLYQDAAGQWWLYYSGSMQDYRLGIYRARQSIPGNWDSWTGQQLVISPGNAVSVGEPTLTAAGDISFVVLTKKSDGTTHNMYDADPWFLPKKKP